MNLNDSQTRAVEHFDGPCLVLAGPGSGKTAVLTKRIERLIKKGVPGKNICVITFTKAAALEMQGRFFSCMPLEKEVFFGTFHSLFWNVIAKEYGYRPEDILIGGRKVSIYREVLSKCNFAMEGEDVISALDQDFTILSSNYLSMEDFKSKKLETNEVLKAYGIYKELKDKYKVADFDDMLIKAYELFTSREDLLNRWQQRFEYFLVDEMQDMNELQFRLIELLAKNRNIFCVGDDDQSIYSFRGAKPELMKSFLEVYPEAVEIYLDTNYRCPKRIINCARKLIDNNKFRFSKEIKGVKDDGIIKLTEIKDSKAEAEYVCQRICELKEQGVELSKIAVLYRNHSDVNYVVENLATKDIPFYLKDNMPNIFTHFIVEDICDYFQVAIGNTTRARMLNIINKPNRYIQRIAVEQDYSIDGLAFFYKGNISMERKVEAFKRDINLISKMGAFGAISYIRNLVGYEAYLKEKAISMGLEENYYYEILNFVQDCVKDCKTISKAIDKIGYLKLKIDYENKNKNSDRNGKVGLYTLHASKGLEFDHVFLIGVNENVIPCKNSLKDNDLEGERRLFYVGLTRAKEEVDICFVNEKNRDRMYPSRFISELKLEENYSSPKASS